LPTSSDGERPAALRLLSEKLFAGSRHTTDARSRQARMRAAYRVTSATSLLTPMFVGAAVGTLEGRCVGALLGRPVGRDEGKAEGSGVGALEGSPVGFDEGSALGCDVGSEVGDAV
jgi:hypothetical protein